MKLCGQGGKEDLWVLGLEKYKGYDQNMSYEKIKNSKRRNKKSYHIIKLFNTYFLSRSFIEKP